MMRIVMRIAGAAMFTVLSMTHWSAALAQMPFPMGPPGGGGQMPGFPFPMGPGQMPGGGMGGMCPIDYVKSTLGITDAQKGVWDSYAALKSNAPSTTAGSGKTAIEQLDAQVVDTENRLKSLRELKPRLAALYAALNTDQKKKADQLVGMGCML